MTGAVEVDKAIATALEALAMSAASGSEPAVLQLENALKSFEHSMTDADVLDLETAAHFRARLALYRTIDSAIKQLSLESSKIWQQGRRVSPRTPRCSLKQGKVKSTKSSCETGGNDNGKSETCGQSATTIWNEPIRYAKRSFAWVGTSTTSFSRI